jgi:hypothetical protein
MAYEVAKQLLEDAGTFLAKTDAVNEAVAQGVPIWKIGEYLDWLEMTNRQTQDQAAT